MHPPLESTQGTGTPGGHTQCARSGPTQLARARKQDRSGALRQHRSQGSERRVAGDHQHPCGAQGGLRSSQEMERPLGRRSAAPRRLAQWVSAGCCLLGGRRWPCRALSGQKMWGLGPDCKRGRSYELQSLALESHLCKTPPCPQLLQVPTTALGVDLHGLLRSSTTWAAVQARGQHLVRAGEEAPGGAAA